MAREVMVVVVCDRCGDRTGSAVEQGGRNSTGTNVLVDLCPNCIAEVMAPYIEVLDKFGRKPVGTRRQRARVDTPCPECGQVFKSNQGMTMHRVRKHGYRKPVQD